MLERDFLNWIIACAERTGWSVWHVPAPMVADSRSGKWRPFKRAAGLPDLFLLHDDPPRLIIAEVKGTGGKLSDAQREFLTLARAVARISGQTKQIEYAEEMEEVTTETIGVYAWVPADQDIIENILKSKVLL